MPPPFPPHVAEERRASRARSTTSCRSRAATAAPGIVQGEKALATHRARHRGERDPYGEARSRAEAEPGERGVDGAEGSRTTRAASRRSRRRSSTSSTQALAPKVGLELDELESVTCCGAGDIHEAEPDYYLHLNARILAYAAATGCDTLLTVCNVCTLNLRQANWQLKSDDELRARVNQNLETVGAPPYERDVDVRHLLWVIAEGEGYERLKAGRAQGAEGPEDRAVLRLPDPAARRSSSASRIPTRRRRSSAIIEACGGEAIDYPAKIKCCGFPIIQAREDTALGELIQPIQQAIEAGADAMVTPCPLCHLSLDAWQSKLESATGKDFDLPILHLSQLIGVAAGLEGVGAEVQAARRLGRAGRSRSSRSDRGT